MKTSPPHSSWVRLKLPVLLLFLPVRSGYTHYHLLSTCHVAANAPSLQLLRATCEGGGFAHTLQKSYRKLNIRVICLKPHSDWIIKLGIKFRFVWLQSMVQMKFSTSLPNWAVSEVSPHLSLGSCLFITRGLAPTSSRPVNLESKPIKILAQWGSSVGWWWAHPMIQVSFSSLIK